jgi:hypothetical protein
VTSEAGFGVAGAASGAGIASTGGEGSSVGWAAAIPEPNKQNPNTRQKVMRDTTHYHPRKSVYWSSSMRFERRGALN